MLLSRMLTLSVACLASRWLGVLGRGPLSLWGGVRGDVLWGAVSLSCYFPDFSRPPTHASMMAGIEDAFSALVDARYDSLLGADARIPAALDEAERLARLPAARWAAVADDVAHNARRSYCASGLRRELALHARALLTLAARIAGVEGRKP